MPFVPDRKRLFHPLAAMSVAVAISCPIDAMSQAQPPAPKAPSAGTAASAGLGTSDYEVPGVEVTLLELKRTSGDTVTARWRYSNSTPKKVELTKSYGGSDPWKLSADTYLIDGTNKKKYLVLTDAGGTPVAAKHGGSMSAISVEPGASLSTWAKYPAPPENVKKVSLYINGVAPFEDIPIAP